MGRGSEELEEEWSEGWEETTYWGAEESALRGAPRAMAGSVLDFVGVLAPDSPAGSRGGGGSQCWGDLSTSTYCLQQKC